MNAPAKSLSARVMEWQARPLWRVIKTEGGKEFDVQGALDKLGYELFVPVEVRLYQPRKGRRGYIEAPLIPRIVFARMEFSVMMGLTEVRHVTGWEKDELGFPEAIPDGQMEDFRATHAEWLAAAQKRAQDGKSAIGRGIRAKRRSVPFRDALMELQRQMETRVG